MVHCQIRNSTNLSIFDIWKPLVPSAIPNMYDQFQWYNVRDKLIQWWWRNQTSSLYGVTKMALFSIAYFSILAYPSTIRREITSFYTEFIGKTSNSKLPQPLKVQALHGIDSAHLMNIDLD